MKSVFISLVLAGSALAFPSVRAAGTIKAVYFQANKDGGNAIRALPVDAHGMVSEGTFTSTGGKGSRMTPVNDTADSLGSQGSVAVSGNYLFVVNAGSNTLSMLEIDANNALKLTLVGKPISTGGDFPNSVAVSKKLGLACVTNTGEKSGIACFHITPQGLKADGQAFRDLPLTPEQTKTPSGPFNTVSQAFFNIDDTALLTTVKGAPMAEKPTFGYFGYFAISKGVVGKQAVFSSPNGTAVLFGSVALPGGNVMATDASFGAALLHVGANGVAKVLKASPIEDNAATCWAAQGATTGLIYTTDDGNEQIGAFSPKTGALINRTVLNAGVPNLIEITSANNLLYALSHGNRTIPPQVVVMQAQGSGGAVKLLQTFKPKNVGIHVEGLGVLVR